jgi:hypothetical protein
MDELIICMTISHRTVAMPMVEADAPTFAQMETEEKPSPAPSASRISDNAAATNAPAITAAQDTPDVRASLAIDGSEIPLW